MCSKTSTTQKKEILPFLVGYVPEFAIRKCREELNETPERKERALRELRSLLQENDKTSGIQFQEDFLIQFLRRNKYRITDTFQHFLNFVNLNKKEKYLFKSIPDHYFDTISSKYMVLLPKRCPDGCAVVIFQVAKWNPKEMPFECAKQMLLMLFYQLLRDPMNQINGFKFIHDFQGTVSYMKYCTPQNLYLFYNTAVNCIPGRYKEIHFINESIVMKTLWNIIKNFLTQKIRDRVFFHSNTRELFDYFPRSIIPTEYGGELQDTGMEDWTRKANSEHEKYSIEGQPNFYSY